MDVNSIMNTYNMASLWNNVNPAGALSSASVPLVNNLDSYVNDSYKQANYFGQGTNSELQNIYTQIQPTYDIPLQYDSSGNLSIPTNIAPPCDGLSQEYSGILPLIQSGESPSDLTDMNIINLYNNIEDGTYKPAISSILSSNPYDIYSNINSILDNQTQSIGGYLDSFV